MARSCDLLRAALVLSLLLLVLLELVEFRLGSSMLVATIS